MARSQKPSQAEQVRQAQRASLARRGEALALQAPTVPGVIPGDPDGLLPAALLTQPLEVRIPAWSNLAPEGQTDKVYLEWARIDSDTYLRVDIIALDGPVNESDFPLRMQVRVADFIEGTLKLRYRVQGWAGPSDLSLDTQITLDSTPPYDNGTPTVLDLPKVPITDEYLAANGDALVCSVPAYPDQMPGDRAAIFYLRDIPENPEDVEPLFIISLDEGHEVSIPRSVLEAMGDGDWYPIYVLIDKAGNISRMSDYEVVQVALGPLPIPVSEPQIPLGHDGMIDLKDAFAGVTVEVARFDNWRSTDQVQIAWGQTLLEPFPIGPAPVFPLSIPVPWSVLKSEYSGEDTQSVSVSYQVLRGSLAFPEEPLSTSTQVNFFVIGPENPDAPNPVNPVLALLEVYGAVSNQANVLTLADHGLDAVAKIKVYAPLKAQQRITLYWNDDFHLDAYYDTSGVEWPDTFIEITIPWELIERNGNHLELPAHYTIEDPFGFNQQHSLATSVRVEVITVKLEPAVFTDLQTTEAGGKLMNCNALHSPAPGVYGFRVHIPADPRYLKEGMKVTLEWYAQGGASGSAIPGTEKTDEITLSAEQAANGIDWFVEPYEQCILPTYGGPSDQYGWGLVHYSAVIGAENVRSDTLREMVAMGMPEGTCDIVRK